MRVQLARLARQAALVIAVRLRIEQVETPIHVVEVDAVTEIKGPRIVAQARLLITLHQPLPVLLGPHGRLALFQVHHKRPLPANARRGPTSTISNRLALEGPGRGTVLGNSHCESYLVVVRCMCSICQKVPPS
eukprot:scaffold312_cov354-Prasinococcus_capsulatus_cf.AAC.5